MNSQYFIDSVEVSGRYERSNIPSQALHKPQDYNIQGEIDHQTQLYKLKLEEQMEKYYKDLDQKESIINQLNYKISKLERSEAKDENMNTHSTHDK